MEGSLIFSARNDVANTMLSCHQRLMARTADMYPEMLNTGREQIHVLFLLAFFFEPRYNIHIKSVIIH